MKNNYFISPLTLSKPIVFFVTMFLLSVTSSGQSATKSAQASSIPESIHKIFEKSCMECHSKGGKLMAMSHVNFSNWESYNQEKQASKAADICKMISKGSMPPKAVRASRPDVIPTAEQVREICQWSESLTKNNKK